MDSALTGGATTDTAAHPLTAADLAAIESLRRMHDAGEAFPADGSNGVATDASADGLDAASGGATCPVPGFLRGGASSCPVMSGSPDGVRRSPADMFVRKLLRIQDAPQNLSDEATYRHFRRSMTISGIRCTLTYVVFPIVLPAFSFLKGVGPIIGILVGSLALVFDTLTIRRFFAVDHRYRWWFSAVAFSIMILLTVLLVQDVSHVVRNLLS